MFKKALLIALVLPVLTAATPATSGHETPQTMQLSSWQSESANGTIVGGLQSVTIINISPTTAEGVTFRLGTPPCDCRLTSASASDGTVSGATWTIGDLGIGATATLDLIYTANK